MPEIAHRGRPSAAGLALDPERSTTYPERVAPRELSEALFGLTPRPSHDGPDASEGVVRQVARIAVGRALARELVLEPDPPFGLRRERTWRTNALGARRVRRSRSRRRLRLFGRTRELAPVRVTLRSARSARLPVGFGAVNRFSRFLERERLRFCAGLRIENRSRGYERRDLVSDLGR
ncbi:MULTISPECIES: hypothetical protein [Sandaracinus]|uniref:hypothetical protein n=1 Tax=Sandaracinus TaxID=1055688 RepID=UPI0019D4AAB5|nr:MULTISPECIES: hypothetical protein [Sandaracinus]